MPRKGRELEQLVSLLERHLTPTDAKITSPDLIPDKQTTQQREVDVSVRLQVGSTPVLIIFECRDRARAQDVQWIEQLAVKRDSVGADVAVAVSSSAFTGPAQRKAEALGVQTRRLEEVTPEAIGGWFAVEHLTRRDRHMQWWDISFEADGKAASVLDDEAEAALARRDSSARVFVSRKDGKRYSLQEIWRSYVASHPDVYAGVKSDGSRLRRTIRMSFPSAEDGYQLPARPVPVDIRRITVTADLWIETTAVPPRRAIAYTTPEGGPAHVEVVEFEPVVDGSAYTVSLLGTPGSGPTGIAVERAGDKDEVPEE